MVAKVFLDTDVVIDYLTDREPFVNHSSTLFELNDQGQIKVYISVLTVSNVHYVSRKLVGVKKSIALLEKLVEGVQVVGTTKKEVEEAFKTGFKDFEDAMQYQTALTIKGIEAIITRNTKDYRTSAIAVFTPELYLKTRIEK